MAGGNLPVTPEASVAAGQIELFALRAAPGCYGLVPRSLTLVSTQDVKCQDATGLSRGALRSFLPTRQRSEDATGLSRGASRSFLPTQPSEDATGLSRGASRSFLLCGSDELENKCEAPRGKPVASTAVSARCISPLKNISFCI
jgi:hypothetical protein